MIDVKFVKLHPEAKVPAHGSAKAAGFDLYAILNQDSIGIPPHETMKIGTGLAIQPPDGYFGAIFARSGLATKSGLRPANCVGVADEDYTGEYMVALHNDTDETKFVGHGDRIAQLVFIPYLPAQFVEVEALDVTERGADGFGSSGK